MKKTVLIPMASAGLLFLTGCQVQNIEKPEAKPVKAEIRQWEYTRFIYELSGDSAKLAYSMKQFNDMGAQGWEVINIVPSAWSSTGRTGDNTSLSNDVAYSVVYLKRPKRVQGE